jgi:diguanylate cyclase (GGDEF)-like protein
VNDRHGHLAGDAALREVGRRLAAVARAGDLVARVGGDEFALVTTPDQLATRADSFARALTIPPIEVAAGAVAISASIGTAIATQGYDPDQLLAAADAAMYRAKGRRPNPVWRLLTVRRRRSRGRGRRR